MRKETFKRLIASIGGGIAIPCLYFLGLLALASTTQILGIYFPGKYFDIVSTPITWAGDLYDYLIPATVEPAYSKLRWAVSITSLIGDFLLYASLTYIFLRPRNKMK
jgi:hypothetical protein